jgi:hypothetical protein
MEHSAVQAMADRLTDIVCDAVLTIRKPDEPIDLYMVSAWSHVCHHGSHQHAWQRGCSESDQL